MAWISYIEKEKGDEKLQKCYEDFASTDGKIDNILKIHSLNPPSMHAHVALYKTLMFGRSDLSRIQREEIAVVVSSINACFY